MIICVCNNISEKKVVEYKKENKNLKTLTQDYAICGSGCKKCLPYFKQAFKTD